MKKTTSHITVRIPDNMLEFIDEFCKAHFMSRSAAIIYLLSKGLIHEGVVEKKDQD